MICAPKSGKFDLIYIPYIVINLPAVPIHSFNVQTDSLVVMLITISIPYLARIHERTPFTAEAVSSISHF